MANLQKATLASGCFWCIEAVFERVQGVVGDVVSGFTGGDTENPGYYQVASGQTDHAEAVQFEFDPEIISYEKILEIFFKTHNPTTLNRQNYDIGPQYRSAIFYHDEAQKELAEKVKKDVDKEKVYEDPIVTTIEKFKKFYKAEDDQQDFYKKHQEVGYCQVIINPKLAKFRKEFESLLIE